jgi:hypothetical protein
VLGCADRGIGRIAIVVGAIEVHEGSGREQQARGKSVHPREGSQCISFALYIANPCGLLVRRIRDLVIITSG